MRCCNLHQGCTRCLQNFLGVTYLWVQIKHSQSRESSLKNLNTQNFQLIFLIQKDDLNGTQVLPILEINLITWFGVQSHHEESGRILKQHFFLLEICSGMHLNIKATSISVTVEINPKSPFFLKHFHLKFFNPCAKGSIDKWHFMHNINAASFNKKTDVQIILKDKKTISLNIFWIPFKWYLNI